MKNKYCRRSRITEVKFRKILDCFSKDLDTYLTAEISGISRQSISIIFQKLRE